MNVRRVDGRCDGQADGQRGWAAGARLRRLSARPERASEGQTVPILGAHCRRCRCVTFELRARCQPACPPHMRPTACCSRFARMQRMRRAVEPSMWTERVPGQRYACPAMLGACQCCVRAMDVGPSAICSACACCGRICSGACLRMRDQASEALMSARSAMESSCYLFGSFRFPF